VIKDEKGNILKEHGELIGETTNNQAEYRALIKGLELAKSFEPEEVNCYLDSELLVKQMRQEYRVKDKGLQPLFVKVWNLALGFKRVKYYHIRRELNKQADWLLNVELDKVKS
jgi:ribonuclease HI